MRSFNASVEINRHNYASKICAIKETFGSSYHSDTRHASEKETGACLNFFQKDGIHILDDIEQKHLGKKTGFELQTCR